MSLTLVILLVRFVDSKFPFLDKLPSNENLKRIALVLFLLYMLRKIVKYRIARVRKLFTEHELLNLVTHFELRRVCSKRQSQKTQAGLKKIERYLRNLLEMGNWSLRNEKKLWNFRWKSFAKNYKMVLYSVWMFYMPIKLRYQSQLAIYYYEIRLKIRLLIGFRGYQSIQLCDRIHQGSWGNLNSQLIKKR